jgi:1,4-alpha-glucan branching enzyme
MRMIAACLLTIVLLVTAGVAQAQFDPTKVCRVEDGYLVFTLDKRWNETQRKMISGMFNLDSALLSAVLASKPLPKDSLTVWTTHKLDASRVELTGKPAKPAGKEDGRDRIFLLDDQWIKLSGAVERESVPYGVNRLTRNTIVNLPGEKVRFFLPGNSKAKKVFVSGSFNDWSTMQNPMQANDSGWTVTLGLKPGKYSYKFIIDGKWTNDPYNRLRENDTYHGYNNIFFCYNYKFVLNGHPDAHNVLVAASFNNWDEAELRMIRFRGTWMLPLYLREGTHAYKFLVDGEWITDPANKVVRPDGKGHMNSFTGLGDTLYFTLKGYPNAKEVALAGNFNAWNPGELFLEKTRGGWQIPYVLAPGNYEYKFLVDGHWIVDPSNPYSTGSGEFTNSFMAVKPNYSFRLEQHSDASSVLVSGSFNGWSKDGYRMVEKDGDWLFPIYLKPGKYTYKFVVDKKWIIDPGNDLWEDNEYGTGNSVLWIEP